MRLIDAAITYSIILLDGCQRVKSHFKKSKKVLIAIIKGKSTIFGRECLLLTLTAGAQPVILAVTEERIITGSRNKHQRDTDSVSNTRLHLQPTVVKNVHKIPHSILCLVKISLFLILNGLIL